MRNATRGHVEFEASGLTHSGAMRNLSQLGCMIEAPMLEAFVGDRISVDLLPDLAASGRIAWRLGDAVGISFDAPVPTQIVKEFALDDWSLRSKAARLAPAAPILQMNTIKT